MKVGVKLRQQGQDENVVVRVSTNDPSTPSAEHFFKAKCPAPFAVVPKTLDFGSVAEGASKQLTLRVLNPRAEPLDAIQRVTCRPALAHVSIYAGLHPHELNVVLEPGTPQGPFSGHLVIRLESTGKELSVPVTGYVAGEVTVAPANVFLRFDPAKQCSNTMIVVVRRCDDKPLGTVTAFEKPPWLSVEDLDQENAKLRRFRVRAESGWDNSPRAKVVLGLQEISKAIAINVDVLPVRVEERSNVP